MSARQCRDLVAQLALVLLSACKSPASTSGTHTLDASPAIDLPTALHGEPPADGGAPSISVMGRDILQDGQVVGDSAAIADAGRPQRLDGLFASLKQSRETWKGAHPGDTFPGVALFSFSASASANLVKSVFQTAAFAGYPNGELAARAPDGSTVALRVDAMVPGPPGASTEHRDGVLLVQVGATSVVTQWRRSGDIVSSVDLGSPSDLTARAQKEWLSYGGHRDKSDLQKDQAMVYVDDAVDYRGLVSAIDAVLAVTREMAGKPQPVAAFDVTFSIAQTPPAGDPGPRRVVAGSGAQSGVGRLAPEVIQRVVREHFAAFRACYETGLGRDANLTGKVSVKFVIDKTGAVSKASDAGSTLADPAVVQCVVSGFAKLVFPPPDGGMVTVVYPINFNPGD